MAHIMIDGAATAIEFYARAFGAEELFRIADQDGRVVHAEIRIHGSLVMLGDPDPGLGFAAPTAAGTSVGLHVHVDDVDGLSERAVRAGAELLTGPADMFYGDRSAILRDPFGHVWVLLTRREDLTIEEIVSRGTRALSA
jgi:PhnB protein